MTSAGFKIPSTLGYRYKLRHKIGSGTFGYVFDAGVSDDLAKPGRRAIFENSVQLCLFFTFCRDFTGAFHTCS